VKIKYAKEPIAKLSETKEINLVAWNGRDPKIDIRNWHGENCEEPGKGITLTDAEAEILYQALKVHLKKT